MKSFADYSLKTKFISITSLTITTALILALSIMLYFTALNKLNALNQNLTIQANIIAENCLPAILFDDSIVATDILSALHTNPIIESAYLDTNEQTHYAIYQHYKTTKNIINPSINAITRFLEINQTSIYRIIYHHNKQIATLSITASLIPLWETIFLDALIGLSIVLSLTVFISGINYYIIKYLLNPIDNLVKTEKQITLSQNYSLRVKKIYPDEIGELTEHFNAMLTQIQLRDNQLEETVIKRTQQLEDAKHIAEKANAAKSEFLANMNHELRTPLNAIIGMGNLLAKSSLTHQQKSYLNNIHIASDILLALIKDTLDFAKIEAGKLELENTEFSLKDITEKLISLCKNKAEQKQLNFKIDSPTQLDNHLLIGDSLRLLQILTNLINNAIKFTDKGHVTLHIEIQEKDLPTSESKRTKLLFRVSDSGIGIPKSIQNNLFLAFTQADSSTTRKYGGTGLGLAISQNLVHMMGGHINVQSQLNQGSQFQFSLSFQKGKKLLAEAPKHPVLTQQHNTKPNNIKTNTQLLLAEDNYINQQVAIENLKILGIHNVIIANNGQEVITHLKHYDIDLILMDIQMPKMDGHQTTQFIRQELKLTLPIIAMTAHSSEENKAHCFESGMTDYLCKPIDNETLHRIFQTHLKSITSEKPDIKTQTPNNLKLKRIQGINSQKILMQFQNNIEKYLTWLYDFDQKYHDTALEIKNHYLSNDLEQAKFLLHSLKGVSANLMLDNISQACNNLSTAIKNKKALQAHDFDELQTCLTSLHDSLNTH